MRTSTFRATTLITALALAACSGGGNNNSDTGTDTGAEASAESGVDAGDVGDAGPNDGSHGETGMDTGGNDGADGGDAQMQGDTGGDAADGSDGTASDGGSTDLCMGGPTPVNLNTAGTRTGSTVTWMGDNTTAPATTIDLPNCGAFGSNAGNVLIFSYTVQATSRLIISTFHAGTADNLDTVAWAQTACAAPTTANTLGCSDDIDASEQNRTPVPPDTTSTESMFTTASTASDATTAAGTTIYIFVGGYSGTAGSAATGTIELTVTEAPVPGVGGGPCDPAAMPSICGSSLACSATGTDYSSFSCATPGTMGSACRTAAPFCDTGLACNLSNVCVTAVADGGTCDLTGATNTCNTGSHCIMGTTTATCIADGTMGGQCSTSGTACMTGLACNSAGVCVTALANGATCDPAGTTGVCMMGSTCVMGASSATCVVDGMQGGVCLSTGTACATGLMCIGTPGDPTSRCVMAVANGGACDPAAQSSICMMGDVCVPGTSGATCQTHGYTTGASTASFIDACAATGATMILSNTDDMDADVMLPFGITFFGVPYAAAASATVSPNGWFRFTQTTLVSYTPGTLPLAFPDNAIYPMFMDLNFMSSTATPPPEVCAATTGTTPSRIFTVEWNHVSFVAGTSTDSATFEIQFPEGGSGAFDIVYQPTIPMDPVGVATVGAESIGGTSFVQVCAGSGTAGCTAGSFVNTHYTPTP